ncbi:hypothetical protein Lupro_02315 [Lutibacter profundi]|uniref:Glycosyltransferase 2-like domain-containing protein n=1 Tax=Lutibacter profundi TaxID=1622118 RepID=A0A0X8G4Z0_9FLAO|nr:glycosyltransferase family A protein [Lutibacter profundi]AMC10153.1 hypothetical protein Lupro_02315 [Lutibacter profundi]
MRIGNNPSNHKIVEANKTLHRVIVPVYIPHETDYFKDALQIFEYCLSSIIKTSITNLKISIISNGCNDAVNDKLVAFQKKHAIDELIIEREGIGKINSVLKALRTADERFITITDADVLFVNGWEQAILDVFKAFPKAGAVCPTPVFRKHFQLTSNIWLKYLFSNRLKFMPVKNPAAMTKFANSIGWPWLDDKYKDVYATLKATNGTVAMVGCSHFVATYKREVFTEIPSENTEFKIRGNSEHIYTDVPVIKKGGYRLSTEDNYTYHMGNILEGWMVDIYKNLKEEYKSDVKFNFKMLEKPLINYRLSEKCFNFLISIGWLKKRIFKMKGLTDAQVQDF